MKNLIFILLLFISLQGWGQSPILNISYSSASSHSISDLGEDSYEWHKQPASFLIGADYLIPFREKNFVSIGIQYRQWKYIIPNYFWGCCVDILIPHVIQYPQSISKEIAIPIQYWVYSRQEPWQAFSRFGITPSYHYNKSQIDDDFYNYYTIEEAPSWKYSADLALGIQRNFAKKFHAYFAINSFLYLDKNPIFMLKHYTDPNYDFKSNNKIGAGLELGIQYSLR